MASKMNAKTAKLRHDLMGALRNLFSVVELAQIRTFDFNSEEGKKLAAQAIEARMLLEKEIERYVELIDRSESR